MKPTGPAKTAALDLCIDRSDRSIAFCLMSGETILESAEVSSDPAALRDWWIAQHKRHGSGLIRVAFEQPALNTVVRAFETVANPEILVDALHTQPRHVLLPDQLPVLLAKALTPRFPGLRNGTLCPFRPLRAGLRNGTL
jgi:hypothetical protein